MRLVRLGMSRRASSPSGWLEGKFKTDGYYVKKMDEFQLQNPNLINPLFNWMKQNLDDCVAEERAHVAAFKAQLDSNNHFEQASSLHSSMQADSVTFIPELEKSVGKLSVQTIRNLHSYIFLYLNRLIHGLLTASKEYFTRHGQNMEEEYNSPPNLVTFTIGDLLRCKISSKEAEIVKVYQKIRAMSEQSDSIKIVRVKNRLKQSTNDVLINVKLQNKVLC